MLAQITEGQAAGSVRRFSVRHEFPTAWAAFRRASAPGGANPRAALTLELRPEATMAKSDFPICDNRDYDWDIPTNPASVEAGEWRPESLPY